MLRGLGCPLLLAQFGQERFARLTLGQGQRPEEGVLPYLGVGLTPGHAVLDDLLRTHREGPRMLCLNTLPQGKAPLIRVHSRSAGLR
jgi:hypothetical protein